MSPYSIVDDGDEINIRATIIARDELLELADKLKQRAEGKAENLTTFIGDQAAHGTIHSVGEGYDAKDVIQTTRKELSNER